MTKDLLVWMTALLIREEADDEAASRELVALHNAVPRLWKDLDLLRQNAERSWLDLLQPAVESGRGFTREAIRRELERVRDDAAGQDPSPLERLLADRVAICWLATVHADRQYAYRLQDGMTFKESEFYQRRCERTQRQLLRAVQTLATVRRLLRPVVQVNVAEQQINVAG